MAVDERRRSELYERLAAPIGPDQAATMFELLPPAGADVATREDLAAVEKRLEQRMEGLEQRMDDRLERLRAELLAAFRGELVTAVSGQTRAVVTATITTALSVTAGIAVLAVAVMVHSWLVRHELGEGNMNPVARSLPGPSTVAIGVFDGVHRGHQRDHELQHDVRLPSLRPRHSDAALQHDLCVLVVHLPCRLAHDAVAVRAADGGDPG
jgi:hypothetical protein